MKKLLAMLLTAAVLTATLAAVASAEGYKPSRSSTCDIEFYVSKADAEDVVKDGKIGEHEYAKLELDLTIDRSPLYIVFGSNSDTYEKAIAMLVTMEYYFSWDDVHGLNIAVRCAPQDLKQTLYVKEDAAYPEDNFLSNTGFGFAFNDCNRLNNQPDNLYYAVARNTETGEYLRGWWTELGVSGAYDPQPGEDFIIEYGDDGYVTCEWSVPFSEIIKSRPVVGTKIYLSVSATSGKTDIPSIPATYGVSLGDRGYLVPQSNSSEHAVAILSADRLDGSEEWDNPFGDVAESSWYYSSVKYVYERGLMTGQSDVYFAAKKQMTRAELVTVLWRMEGEPLDLGSLVFSDVEMGEWYTEAVKWASTNGIVEGYSDGRFKPNAPVTREQLAVILHRYTEANGGDDTSPGRILSYPDASEVSSWAVDSVKWAFGRGLLSGKPVNGETSIAPAAGTTRAELATILMRYGA